MTIQPDPKSAFKIEVLESVKPGARCVPGVYTAMTDDDGTQFILMARDDANLKKAVAKMKTPPERFKEEFVTEVILMAAKSAKLSEEI